jgi:hypothetical protein
MADAAGDMVSGSCAIQAVGAFETVNGWRVIGAPMTVQFTAGAFTASLAPTDSVTPSGQYYKVTCAVPRQTVSGRLVAAYRWGPEIWLVPTRSSPVDIGSVVTLSAPGAMSSFADGETPAGAIDGINGAFTLASSPAPGLSLILTRNGMVQEQGLGYTLSGRGIAFLSGNIPGSGDTLQAWYRRGAVIGASFADGETPAGTIDGTNATFTLAHAPNPAVSLLLIRNGLGQSAGLDYTLSGITITFVSAAIPQPGDALVAWYRY